KDSTILSEYYELIFRSLGRPINDKEIKVNQLLEHQNQNASTRLIIDYLDLIKKIIQLLRYSNLFDFDQLLISTQIGSIEEIRVNITYLLSLCEYGDLHLRGACANLLVTLIQTTNHLLTLSSLSNSFNNSFIN
ncbi:unnamed protein product, partial [Rotaria sp. Silwood1]